MCIIITVHGLVNMALLDYQNIECVCVVVTLREGAHVQAKEYCLNYSSGVLFPDSLAPTVSLNETVKGDCVQSSSRCSQLIYMS